MRTLATQSIKQVGQTITAMGWVQSRRDHGGLIFIDLRDHTGLLQLVINPETAEAFKIAEELRDEFVIAATGTVAERDESLLPKPRQTKNYACVTGISTYVAQKCSTCSKDELTASNTCASICSKTILLRSLPQYWPIAAPKVLAIS